MRRLYRIFPPSFPEREQAKKVEEYINTLEGLVQEAHQIKRRNLSAGDYRQPGELKDLKTNELLVVQLICPWELPGGKWDLTLSRWGKPFLRIGDD